jgi:outer membrane protein TolC
LKGDCRTLGAPYVSGARSRSRRVVKSGVALIVVTCLAACMVGPDYRKPEVQVPEGFKEGVDWQRAEANPQAAISSTWWRTYGDDKLNGLVEQALQANQSIASAEAAYRVALATVEEDRAGLFPVVKAGWRFSGKHRVVVCRSGQQRRGYRERQLGTGPVGADTAPARASEGERTIV